VRLAVFPVLAPAAIAAFQLVGCKGSVEGNVNTGGKGDVADFDKPLDQNLSVNRASSEDAAKDSALLGERQDLSYRGPPTSSCKCMEVALGQPGDRAFAWAGGRPTTMRDSQLVFAMSSAGIACPGAGDKPTGASYWGYEVVGNDVVVVVERAYAGRPVASGAIIPRPTGNGQVYVRPIDKTLPYGGPVSGTGDRCQIGKLEAATTPGVLAPPTQKAVKGDLPSPFSAESTIP
jgi:hypothetical protein